MLICYSKIVLKYAYMYSILNKILFTLRCYITSFKAIGPVVLEKKIFFKVFAIYGHGGHLGM